MLNQLEQDEFRAIRDVFTRAEYSVDGLLGCLGPVYLPNRPGKSLAHLLHLTRGGRPLDTLIRLFLIGVTVEIEAANAALEPVPIDTWIRAGLLESRDGLVRGRAKIVASQDLLLAADQATRPEVCELPDQVMGVTASTLSLAYMTVRRPACNTLDLGTGCGIQALLASDHSERVWATDITARSLNFARFNAGLNGRTNIDFLQGDLFDPVPDLRFDLILSNPPFAISPSRRYVYRDSGMAGDGFCRRVIEQAPRHLVEGGYFHIICDWLEFKGQDWKERLSSWFESSECDVWAMKIDTHDPASYTNMWIHDTEDDDLEETGRRYEEWISWFEREQVETVGSGLIVMRRTGGRPNWIRLEDGPEIDGGPVGKYVLLGFQLTDFLSTVSDEALLDAPLCLSPDLRIDQRLRQSEEKWQLEETRIRLSRGLQFNGNVDRNAMALIVRCNGKRTFREAIAEAAAELKVDVAKMIPASLQLIRKLIERGYLLPGPGNGPPAWSGSVMK